MNGILTTPHDAAGEPWRDSPLSCPPTAASTGV